MQRIKLRRREDLSEKTLEVENDLSFPFLPLPANGRASPAGGGEGGGSAPTLPQFDREAEREREREREGKREGEREKEKERGQEGAKHPTPLPSPAACE